jgi:hypothetical protein
VPVTADVGIWTGGLAWQPPYAAAPLTIPFGQVDDDGTAWCLQKVQGWDSPPAAVGQVVQRSADHGGYATPQFYGPRILTLTVWASAQDQAARDRARAKLQAAVPVSSLGVFQYDEPISKLAYVRRNATAGVTELLPTYTDAQFVIPLVAPDPRKYAIVASSASSLTPPPVVSPLTLPFAGGFPVTFPAGVVPGAAGIVAVNAGTFETRPMITVQGPASSPSVVNGMTGQAITFTGLVLGAADVLVINTDSRQAFLNGVFTPADPASSWWVMWPGVTGISLQGGEPGAVLSGVWSSAWMLWPPRYSVGHSQQEPDPAAHRPVGRGLGQSEELVQIADQGQQCLVGLAAVFPHPRLRFPALGLSLPVGRALVAHSPQTRPPRPARHAEHLR